MTDFMWIYFNWVLSKPKPKPHTQHEVPLRGKEERKGLQVKMTIVLYGIWFRWMVNNWRYVCTYYITSARASPCAAGDVLQVRNTQLRPGSKESNAILESSINRINLILVFRKCSCIFYLIIGSHSSNFSMTCSISKVRKLLLFQSWQ